MAAFRITAFSPLGGSRRLFPRFSSLMGSAILALSGSMPDLTRLSACYREDFQYECGRPRDILSCLFFTALRLGQGQSMLTQVRQTNDIDMTCYKTSTTKSVTCLHLGAHSPRVAGSSTWRIWSIQIQMTHTWKMLFLLLHIYVGGAMLLTTCNTTRLSGAGTQVSIFLKVVFDASPGY